MNTILQNIISRRSCKKYRSDPVDPALIEQIVEAGLYAASSNGKQAAIILAVTDKETRDLLSRLNAKYDQKKRPDPFYNAPAVLVVLAPKASGAKVYDGSLVMGNLMLAAHSLGVDSCWIHRARETFEDEEGKALLKRLGIEEEYEGIGNCILGYADYELPAAAPRRPGRVFHID
ncbi:MAG: nitroreductase [Solobacterium sp.]|nr:nitroreductase [Solobacterium sp.]